MNNADLPKQIARLKAGQIAKGNVLNADDVSVELNQLVDEHNRMAAFCLLLLERVLKLERGVCNHHINYTTEKAPNGEPAPSVAETPAHSASAADTPSTPPKKS